MTQKRILFLSTRLPFPPVGGERLWAYYTLKYLSMSFSIDLCVFVGNAKEREDIGDCPFKSVEVFPVNLAKSQSYINCLKGLFAAEPLQVNYYASKDMDRIVGSLLNSRRYDFILCHLIRMARYAGNCRHIKKVLYLADALSLRYAMSSKFRKGIFKFVEALEAHRLGSYELKCSENFNLNIVASSIDKDYFERKNVNNLYLMPNGVDAEDLVIKGVNTDFKKIVYFANLRAYPNIDAIVYFYKIIFPLIRKKIGDAKLVIAGAHIPDAIMRFNKDGNVSIHKDVDSIRPYVEDACVSVAPMRIAVGIQNKILQSMAWRVPVVTTTQGLGSIEAKPDRDILVTDAPQDFSAKVISLMQDGKLRDYIAGNGYNLIKEKYLWPDIVGKLNSKLLSIL